MLGRATSLLKASQDAAKAASDTPADPVKAKPADAEVTRAEARLKAAQDALKKTQDAQAELVTQSDKDQATAAKLKPADGPNATDADKAAFKKATDAANASAERLAAGKKAVEAAQKDVAEQQTQVDAARKGAAGAQTAGAKPDAAGGSGQKKPDLPSWAAIASFKMKSVRQRGKMRWDLNKYTESTITLRFDGNIGDVRRYKDHFRRVNLDDPLYQQRELAVYLDGLNASDFSQYVNFVTVRMHKRHAGGAVTDDEVLIDRNNFNREGNGFKLLYGWKGDDDRSRWMEYEYQTLWSFFGGKTVETPMQRATGQAIAVAPPYQRRTVELQADPADLAKAEVRSLNVKLFYDLAGSPQVRQVTLDASKPQSARIEFMSLPDALDYEYEITWRRKGNRTVSSGRQKASDAILDVGDVPQG
jgi:hypothetical protein